MIFNNEGELKKYLLSLDWSLKSTNMKELTHDIHIYPARMPPLIVRRLIKNLSKSGDTILDPFSGSGTIILEAFISDRRCIGSELNPLGVKIAKVKTTPLDSQLIETQYHKLINIRNKDIDLMEFEVFKRSHPMKTIQWLNYWFIDDVQHKLYTLKKAIETIENVDIKDFFEIVLSNTARNVSNNRNNSYKNHKISAKKMEIYHPNVYAIFDNFYTIALQGMNELFNKQINNTPPDIKLQNFFEVDIKDNSIDMVLTSPPYGDSQTTVGYGQFSKFSLFWLDYSPAVGSMIDSSGLGGKKLKKLTEIHSKTFYEIKEQIKNNEKDMKNNNRHMVFHYFFQEYEQALKKIAKVLKNDSFACLVVGNRTMRDVKIPLDTITIEIAKHYNLQYWLKIYRDISNNRQSNNINKETIIIMKKTI